jgi:hypothetical protein
MILRNLQEVDNTKKKLKNSSGSTKRPDGTARATMRCANGSFNP